MNNMISMNRLICLLVLLASCHPSSDAQTPQKDQSAQLATVQQQASQDAAAEAAKAKGPPSAHFYLANQDGTVLDSTSGLLWPGADHAATDWETANKLCKEESAGGKTGWRLPTIEELRTLYYSAEEPHVPECAAGQSEQKTIHHPKAIYLSCYSYWAKETNGDPWAYFFERDMMALKPSADIKFNVLCVHDR